MEAIISRPGILLTFCDAPRLVPSKGLGVLISIVVGDANIGHGIGYAKITEPHLTSILNCGSNHKQTAE